NPFFTLNQQLPVNDSPYLLLKSEGDDDQPPHYLREHHNNILSLVLYLMVLNRPNYRSPTKTSTHFPLVDRLIRTHQSIHSHADFQDNPPPFQLVSHRWKSAFGHDELPSFELFFQNPRYLLR